MNGTTIYLDMYEYATADNMMDYLATAALTMWTIGVLWFITKSNNNQIPPPPFYTAKEHEETNWHPVGIYHLNKQHQLSKAERQALEEVSGTATHLYEKIHASGNKSWRYKIGDTWFYPRETMVKRRGLDMFGNHTKNLVD
jgi:hypothetical protein